MNKVRTFSLICLICHLNFLNNHKKDYHKEQFIRFAERANKLGLVAIEKSIKLAENEIDKNIFWRNNLYPKLSATLDKAIIDLRLTN